MNQSLADNLLQVDDQFSRFINEEVLPHTGLDATAFWQQLAELVADLMPRNKQLLDIRDSMQRGIEQWHKANPSAADGSIDSEAYTKFLTEIGYLQDSGDDFQITTENVDAEIATMAGPQLVVPLKNARFALNAANARWGSLYDALYGTDVIPATEGREAVGSYNPVRGDAVIAYAKTFLDSSVPLENGSHENVTSYQVRDENLIVNLDNDASTLLASPNQFIGYTGKANAPASVLLKNNGLHIDLQINPEGNIGKNDSAGINDVILESAITTIMDCEDSIAAVDAEDKVEVYQNWLGLMRGDLEERFVKNDKEIVRRLNPDRSYTDRSGAPLTLPGRSLLFIRNVGHLMTIDVIKTSRGELIPEGILDAVFTALIGSFDLNDSDQLHNSRTGSIYIVKPKMHGPEEVKFTCELFTRVEAMLGLAANTLKLGIMDEERRTTVNLEACIREAGQRLVFINTGFLDRTGDEIHTSMEAGAFLPKDQIKNEAWISAYEQRNVLIGLDCGLAGKAQIGKGMWAKPDEMAEMMEQKIGHPKSGATTAWVPSPTAATLHAMHYHEVNVFDVQKELQAETSTSDQQSMADVLTPALLGEAKPDEKAVIRELENNAQGILGYVVRWVEHGVGCSKVPDINNVGLMEDRATLRISAKHIANWLHHGLCNEQQVLEVLARMAAVVDGQNADDPEYVPMAEDLDNSLGFQAAKALIFQSQQQPNGYTEPLLHEFRIKQKAKLK